MAKKVRGVRANKPNDSFGTINSDTLYKGNYREEVYKDEDEENTEEEVEAQDANPDEESATSQENDETFATKTESTEPDYKKRYDDLKRHYDTKLAEWKSEKETYLNKMMSSEPVSMSDSSNIGQFKEQYPEMYDAIHQISSSNSEARVKNLEGELEEIKRREKNLEKQKAYEELLRLQPDFDDIKKSEEFTNWLQSQPKSISDGVYDNATDARWASRVVDLYKADNGLSKSTKKPVSKKKDAAMSVSKGTAREVASSKVEGKIWKASEIRSLKPWEFEKLEGELDTARQEGRIDPNN